MLDRDTEKFMSNVSEPDFSAYSFLRMFSAIIFIKGNHSFNRDNLILFIELNKREGRHNSLLEDIKLKNNGIFSYSEDLDNAYSILKWANVLYTVSSEKDSLIYIEDNIPVVDMITCKANYYSMMESFVDEFLVFEKENQNVRVLN